MNRNCCLWGLLALSLAWSTACVGNKTIKPAQAPAGTVKAGQARAEAERLVNLSPLAQPFVFSGRNFPRFEFESPAEAQKLLGPYKISAVFYDVQYRQVAMPDKPGRYGAIVEIKPEKGETLRRFVTLFCQPQNLRWWQEKIAGTFPLPRELGIDPHVAAESEELSQFLKERFFTGLERDPGGAVLLAGLFERGSDASPKGYYDNVWLKDRQWWLGLKRKLYGWDQRWPKPFVGPQPIEGKPAPVLRPGTPQEAGMKPEAVKALDDMLTQWAAESDEGFSVCFARHGVIFLYKAYGQRDGKPMTVQTKCWMASFTKMMSGTLWGMLFDQGLVHMDDPASMYFPPLARVTAHQPLTIRRLYNHTAGFSDNSGDDEQNDLEERVVSLLPQLQIGQSYYYNGSDMALACKALEAVSGETLPQFYKKHLFDPLGCDIDAADASHGARAAALDVAKILQLHLNRGAYGQWRFFSRETADRLLPQAIGPQIVEYKTADSQGLPVHYGHGTQSYYVSGLTDLSYGHGAASSSIMRVDPVHDLLIVMTRNAAGKNFEKYCPKFIEMIVDGITDRQVLPNLNALFATTDTELDSRAGKFVLDQRVANDSDLPVDFQYRINTKDTCWRAASPEGRLTLPARGNSPLHVELAFDPNQPLPTPQIVGVLRCGSFAPIERAIDLRPRIRRATTVARVAKPPAIDGVIAKGEYGDAPANSGLGAILHSDLTDKPTSFWLAYDDQNLYVAVKAQEPNAGDIQTPHRLRDGDIWQDDSIEVFIDANHDRTTYRQFLTNLNGDQYDAIGGPKCGRWGDKKWNATWRSAGKVGRDFYVIEFAIPFSELGIKPPKPGDVWGLNLGRTRSAQTGKAAFPQSAAWAVSYVNFHEVSHFGDVYFK